MNITSATLEVTDLCNMYCKHCYNKSGPVNNPHDIDLETLQMFLTDIKENNQGRLDEIWVSGGEPLLHKRFQEVIELLFSFNYQPIIATSGVYDHAVLAKLIGVKRYVRRVHISLEGLDGTNDFIRGKGGFEHVIKKTIPVLKSAGFHVCITVHLRKGNQSEIRALTDLVVDQLDCDLKFGILRPIGRARNHLLCDMLTPAELYKSIRILQELKSRYKVKRIWHDWDILSNDVKFYTQNYQGKSSCPAGLQTTITCTSEFDIYPCSQLRGPGFKLGNWQKHQCLQDILENSDFREIDKLLNTKPQTCLNCLYYKTSCQGGCPAVAYGLTCDAKDLSKADPYCFVKLIP
jgi:radical SAM protein with 4Fe4S-binding SPASM domain